mmetsp:Transcript_6910/g.25771  ORF Transcript_6910/g.25771 Transcript_6910/m.25771 type:complete len:277 (-) Transcript_6910:1916-2746(-)
MEFIQSDGIHTKMLCCGAATASTQQTSCLSLLQSSSFGHLKCIEAKFDTRSQMHTGRCSQLAGKFTLTHSESDYHGIYHEEIRAKSSFHLRDLILLLWLGYSRRPNIVVQRRVLIHNNKPKYEMGMIEAGVLNLIVSCRARSLVFAVDEHVLSHNPIASSMPRINNTPSLSRHSTSHRNGVSPLSWHPPTNPPTKNLLVQKRHPFFCHMLSQLVAMSNDLLLSVILVDPIQNTPITISHEICHGNGHVAQQHQFPRHSGILDSTRRVKSLNMQNIV